jgi:hypothetical protein
MSYHAMAAELLSWKSTRTIDSAGPIGLVELDELAFAGWRLEGVKERASRAGNPYLSYRFTRAAEPERRAS